MGLVQKSQRGAKSCFSFSLMAAEFFWVRLMEICVLRDADLDMIDCCDKKSIHAAVKCNPCRDIACDQHNRLNFAL